MTKKKKQKERQWVRYKFEKKIDRIIVGKGHYGEAGKNRQMNRQTVRQTDRQLDKQKDK